MLMEAADALAAELKSAEAAAAKAKLEGNAERNALATERAALEHELQKLSAQRARKVAETSPTVFAKYDQILKSRRGLAVVQMLGEICSACHVRLRPQIAQVVRRNEDVVQCESCQRILYYVPMPEQAAGHRP
jgi:predicted  nucleic acid-binding Zn-ribbon protein